MWPIITPVSPLARQEADAHLDDIYFVIHVQRRNLQSGVNGVPVLLEPGPALALQSNADLLMLIRGAGDVQEAVLLAGCGGDGAA